MVKMMKRTNGDVELCNSKHTALHFKAGKQDCPNKTNGGSGMAPLLKLKRQEDDDEYDEYDEDDEYSDEDEEDQHENDQTVLWLCSADELHSSTVFQRESMSNHS